MGSNDFIIRHIMETEGWPRYTDHPHDRGGATKGGITRRTLADWRGEPVSKQALRKLSRGEGSRIYRERYIQNPGFDQIRDDLLRWQVVDAGVLHGPKRATRWLQAVIGTLDVDGIFGPATAKAVAAADPRRVALRFAVMRIRFLGRLLNRNAKARRDGKSGRDQALFAEGWLNRATRFVNLEAGDDHD